MSDNFVFNVLDAKELVRIAQRKAKGHQQKKPRISEEYFDEFKLWLNKEFANWLIKYGIDGKSGEIEDFISELKTDDQGREILLKKTVDLLNTYKETNGWVWKRLNDKIEAANGLDTYKIGWKRLKLESSFDLENLEEFIGYLQQTEIILSKKITNLEGRYKKGRPSIKWLKLALFQAAIHFRKFSGYNPSFMRHKVDGKYEPITNWHFFAAYLVNKVQPFLKKKITDKELSTACEHVVQQLHDIDFKVASEIKAKFPDKIRKKKR